MEDHASCHDESPPCSPWPWKFAINPVSGALNFSEVAFGNQSGQISARTTAKIQNARAHYKCNGKLPLRRAFHRLVALRNGNGVDS